MNLRDLALLWMMRCRILVSYHECCQSVRKKCCNYAASFPILPVAASIVSAMAAFVVAKMESKVGKSIGSQSLIANSREAMLDVFTSLVVSIGILLAYFKIPYVEGAIIILIAILLFKLGIENIWTSLLILNEFLNEQRHIGVKVARVIVK